MYSEEMFRLYKGGREQVRYRGESTFKDLINKIYEKYLSYKILCPRLSKLIYEYRKRIGEIYKIACPKDRKGNLIDYNMGLNDGLREEGESK